MPLSSFWIHRVASSRAARLGLALAADFAVLPCCATACRNAADDRRPAIGRSPMRRRSGPYQG